MSLCRLFATLVSVVVVVVVDVVVVVVVDVVVVHVVVVVVADALSFNWDVLSRHNYSMLRSITLEFGLFVDRSS